MGPQPMGVVTHFQHTDLAIGMRVVYTDRTPNPDWHGRVGIIVGETVNSWQIKLVDGLDENGRLRPGADRLTKRTTTNFVEPEMVVIEEQDDLPWEVLG